MPRKKAEVPFRIGDYVIHKSEGFVYQILALTGSLGSWYCRYCGKGPNHAIANRGKWVPILLRQDQVRHMSEAEKKKWAEAQLHEAGPKQ